MLRAIRMCLQPTAANANNILRLLVSLSCALGTTFTSGFISLLEQIFENKHIYFMILDICGTMVGQKSSSEG